MQELLPKPSRQRAWLVLQSLIESEDYRVTDQQRAKMLGGGHHLPRYAPRQLLLRCSTAYIPVGVLREQARPCSPCMGVRSFSAHPPSLLPFLLRVLLRKKAQPAHPV